MKILSIKRLHYRTTPLLLVLAIGLFPGATKAETLTNLPGSIKNQKLELELLFNELTKQLTYKQIEILEQSKLLNIKSSIENNSANFLNQTLNPFIYYAKKSQKLLTTKIINH